MSNSDKKSRKYLGNTPPVSIIPSTEADLKLTKALQEALRREGQFETTSEAQKREHVLGQLSQLALEFIFEISILRSIPDPHNAGGKIFTFGSYRLGVHNGESDIDALLVAPKHVQREDFFGIMYEKLRSTHGVTELVKVEDAYVPLIKMCFSGVAIDLVFARLALPSIPADLDLTNDNLILNLDERCIRSLNGSRVTDEILRLVPNPDTFRLSLKCIKLWAKRRAIYSNVMGFLGGVAWAMLVARMCQFYPNASAGVIVSKFFRIFYSWPWPHPVLLKPIEDGGPLRDRVRVWNPKTSAHRMPVITPAYPSMCATHNVTESTKLTMTAEFRRAADIADKVVIGAAQWDELWERHDFFRRYWHYIQVIVSSESKDVQVGWAGMVESRIRQFVMMLESVDAVVVAQPFIKGFKKDHMCRNIAEVYEAGTGFSSSLLDFDDAKLDHPVIVHTTTFYIGVFVVATPRTPRKKLDVSDAVKSFFDTVMAWENYDEKRMHIAVNTLKRSMLPPEVMDERSSPVTGKRRKLPEKITDPSAKRRRSNVVCSREASEILPMEMDWNTVDMRMN